MGAELGKRACTIQTFPSQLPRLAHVWYYVLQNTSPCDGYNCSLGSFLYPVQAKATVPKLWSVQICDLKKKCITCTRRKEKNKNKVMTFT